MNKDKELLRLRRKYQKGLKISLVKMAGESQMSEGMIGIVEYVDDAGQIHMKWENGSSLALHEDEDDFEIIAPENIHVILVKPNFSPELVEIHNELKSMQKLVGGDIEQISPFDDPIHVIYNRIGKSAGLEGNRVMCNHNGHPRDILNGDFFLGYAPIECDTLLDMPDDLAEKYMKLMESNSFQTDTR